MDRLAERLTDAERALATLPSLIAPRLDVERDSAIMRLAYTFEAVWKVARQYLVNREKEDVSSLGATISRCRASGILSDDQAAAAMRVAEDRNLVAHTDNKDLSRALVARLPEHARLMTVWLGAIRERVRA